MIKYALPATYHNNIKIEMSYQDDMKPNVIIRRREITKNKIKTISCIILIIYR